MPIKMIRKKSNINLRITGNLELNEVILSAYIKVSCNVAAKSQKQIK
jgi:hypothetical protein